MDSTSSTSQPPSLPPGHVGGDLPTTPAEVAAAAQAAALGPLVPPGGVSPPPMPPSPPPAVAHPPASPGLDPVQMPPPATAYAKQNGAHAPPPAAPAGFSIPPALAASGPLPVMHDLIKQAMDQAAKQNGYKYYAVVIPDDGVPHVEVFEELTRLQSKLRELFEQNEEANVFAFYGNWLQTSKGPYRHLKTPYAVLPLYKMPAADEIQWDESGWAGKESQELKIPQALPREETPTAMIAEPVNSDTPIFDGHTA